MKLRLMIALLAACSAAPAYAQQQYRAFVRFEQAKTGQPLSTPVTAENLRVMDDGKPAVSVELASAEDLPIKLVLAFDVSRSEMSGVQRPLRKSAADFLRTVVRRGKDSVTLIDFNDEYYVDAGPTDDVEKVAQALKKYDDYRGGTALFETVVAACRQAYGHDGAARERRVLLLFSDGQDNASPHANLQKAIVAAQDAGVSIFAISSGGRERIKANVWLEQLALGTGGRVFAGIKPNETDAFFAFLRRVLASQFMLTYTLAEQPRRDKHRPFEIVSRRKDVRAFAAQVTPSQQ